MFNMLLSRHKLQLIAIGAVILFTTLAGTHYKAYIMGKNYAAAEDLKVISAYQKKMAGYEEDLANERSKIRTDTDKRISKLRKVTDPTGCLDTVAPPSVLQQLDDSDR